MHGGWAYQLVFYLHVAGAWTSQERATGNTVKQRLLMMSKVLDHESLKDIRNVIAVAVTPYSGNGSTSFMTVIEPH